MRGGDREFVERQREEGMGGREVGRGSTAVKVDQVSGLMGGTWIPGFQEEKA